MVAKYEVGSPSGCRDIGVEEKEVKTLATYISTTMEVSPPNPAHFDGCIFTLQIQHLFENEVKMDTGKWSTNLLGNSSGRPVAISHWKSSYWARNFNLLLVRENTKSEKNL